jgi:hypothetical protein
MTRPLAASSRYVPPVGRDGLVVARRFLATRGGASCGRSPSCLARQGCAGSSTGGGGTAGGPSDEAGGGDPNATQAASCSVTETLMFGTSQISITFCSDTSGLTADQVNALKMSCMPHPGPDAGVTISGTYSSGPCPPANRVGGCSVMSGSYSQTAWYYSGGQSHRPPAADDLLASGRHVRRPLKLGRQSWARLPTWLRKTELRPGTVVFTGMPPGLPVEVPIEVGDPL